jgi:mono/diheme cytochrome c family protein
LGGSGPSLAAAPTTEEFATLVWEGHDALPAAAVDEQGIADVLGFVRVVPAILAATPDLQLGASTYAQHCAACHGARGNGSFGPALTTVIPDTLFTATVWQGRRFMPGFFNVLDNQEVANVLGYVRSLQ